MCKIAVIKFSYKSERSDAINNNNLQDKIMAPIKVILILPFYLFAIFQLIGCVEHVKKRKDVAQRQGKSKLMYFKFHNSFPAKLMIWIYGSNSIHDIV